MSVIQQSSSQRLAYAGGNEVFFSFLRSLMESVDQKIITQEQFRTLVRQWGVSLAQQALLEKDLLVALEQLAELFSVMGLVRVFEPAQTDENETPMILVMRCMTSRILFPSRRQKSLPIENIIPLLLEGALDSVGHAFHVIQDNKDALHGDEYILRLEPR
ncbi:MAG: hypothetical protein H6728_15095 [Myxococcales bacterium]|nr:hypothetical protein [Myxococcales bacterium]